MPTNKQSQTQILIIKETKTNNKHWKIKKNTFYYAPNYTKDKLTKTNINSKSQTHKNPNTNIHTHILIKTEIYIAKHTKTQKHTHRCSEKYTYTIRIRNTVIDIHSMKHTNTHT